MVNLLISLRPLGVTGLCLLIALVACSDTGQINPIVSTSFFPPQAYGTSYSAGSGGIVAIYHPPSEAAYPQPECLTGVPDNITTLWLKPCPETNIDIAFPAATTYTLWIVPLALPGDNSGPVRNSLGFSAFVLAGAPMAVFTGTSEAGVVTLSWDASNAPSGLYRYYLVTDQWSDYHDVILIHEPGDLPCLGI